MVTKKDIDGFMEDNPEYSRLRLKDPKIIKVFLIVMWRTNGAVNDITRLQTILLDLLGRHIDIIG